MNEEVYFVECIKPSGESILTIPLQAGPGLPALMPVAITCREVGEACWERLMKIVANTGLPIPEGSTYRLVRYQRVEVLKEWVIERKETSLSA